MFVPTPGWEMKILWREEGPKGPNVRKGWDVPLAARVGQARAMNAVLTMMATLFRLEKSARGQIKVVRTHRQLTSAMERGVLAVVMHIEGAEALKKDLDALPVLYEAGLRSLGPVWSRPNSFGHGVPFNFPDTPDIGPGLSSAGKDLVRLCNQLGIVVDLSHLNARGFWDVVAPFRRSDCGLPLCSARSLPFPQKPDGRPVEGCGGVRGNRWGQLRPGVPAKGRQG